MRRIFRPESRFQQGEVGPNGRRIGLSVGYASRAGMGQIGRWDRENKVLESRFVLTIFVFPLVSFSSIRLVAGGAWEAAADVPEIRGLKSPAKGLRPRSPRLRTARCR